MAHHATISTEATLTLKQQKRRTFLLTLILSSFLLTLFILPLTTIQVEETKYEESYFQSNLAGLSHLTCEGMPGGIKEASTCHKPIEMTPERIDELYGDGIYRNLPPVLDIELPPLQLDSTEEVGFSETWADN